DERAAMESTVMAVEAVMPTERVPTADVPATDSATAHMPATTAAVSTPATAARVRRRAAGEHQHCDQCDQPNQPAHFKHLIVMTRRLGLGIRAVRGRV